MATLREKYGAEIFLGVFVAFVAAGRAIWVDPRVSDTGEHAPTPEEIATTEEIRRQALAFIERHKRFDKAYKRDAHLNPHGCVTAEFRVLEEIEPRLQQGAFSIPGRRYPAWVRFSNGTLADDTKPDGRGMAIKLMDVPGDKLLPEQRAERTQDFVMVNHHTFILRDVKEYLAFFKQQVEGEQFGYFIGWNPFEWHLRELRIGLEMLLQDVPSPLATTYFSMLPYKFGEALNVKYSALPCEPAVLERCEPLERDMPEEVTPYYLRKALVDDLAPKANPEAAEAVGGRFVFRVQVQDPTRNMPVEDATIEWSQDASPYVPVGELTIQRQRFNSAAQNEHCEALSFTPWHTLPEHRPIGGLNRARRVLYDAISKRRHEGNATVRAEPKDFTITSRADRAVALKNPEAAP